MTGMLWGGLAVLVLVALTFMVLWVLDARRADRVATDVERVDQRASWRQPRRRRAAHRARPHP